MRELVLRIHITDLERLGFGQFIDCCRRSTVCCRRSEVCRFEMLSCQSGRQKWLVRTNAPLDTSNVIDGDNVDNAVLLCNNDGEYEYLVLSKQSDPSPLSTTCPKEVICEGKILPERDFAEFVLVASEDVIETVNKELTKTRVDYEIVRIGKYKQKNGVPESLTARQREIIMSAYDQGYYEFPRSANLDDIAISSNLDKSTVSEHLRRAEKNILEKIFGKGG